MTKKRTFFPSYCTKNKNMIWNFLCAKYIIHSTYKRKNRNLYTVAILLITIQSYLMSKPLGYLVAQSDTVRHTGRIQQTIMMPCHANYYLVTFVAISPKQRASFFIHRSPLRDKHNLWIKRRLTGCKCLPSFIIIA